MSSDVTKGRKQGVRPSPADSVLPAGLVVRTPIAHAADAADTGTAPPVGVAEFAGLADDLELAPPVAVAVSGGGDSMALLLLLQRWSDGFTEQGTTAFGAEEGAAGTPPLTAITVDHGLRNEARQEAQWVAEQAARWGVPHIVLRHDGPVPDSNVQAWARETRYRLIEAWCRANHVPTLLTAHTQDDQAETVLMRLARGSGVDGLAGMASRTLLRDPGGRHSIELVRPLLGVSRRRLRATLEKAGQAWLEDPTNQDDRFTRVRIRRLLGLLEAEGLGMERLAATADRMARARSALDELAHEVMAGAVVWHRAGLAWIDLDVLLRVPEDIRLRVLRHVVQIVGGAAYPPRHDRLLRLASALDDGNERRVRTLGGCRIGLAADGGMALVTRENRNHGEALLLEPGQVGLWDGRFQVSLPRGSLSGEVRALGRDGLRAFRAAGVSLRAAVPPVAGASLPALWRGDDVIAVPHLDYDIMETDFRAVFLTPSVGTAGHLDAVAGHPD